jgi:hypothetical protein
MGMGQGIIEKNIMIYLSNEEYQVLYSNKEGWQKNEERYIEFFFTLKNI